MNISEEENRQVVLVDRYVREKADVRHINSQKKWFASVTICGYDYQESGDISETALRRLVNRIFGNQLNRLWVLSQIK